MRCRQLKSFPVEDKDHLFCIVDTMDADVLEQGISSQGIDLIFLGIFWPRHPKG